MKYFARLLSHKILIAFLAIFLLAELFGVLYYFEDYSEAFIQRKGVLVRAEREAIDSSFLFRKSRLTLRNSDGFAVQCGLLEPHGVTKKYPAVILLGGFATGSHAVDYVVGLKNIIIVAVDYPYVPRENYNFAQIVRDIPDIRKALLDMIPSTLLVLDYLRTRPDVDSSKIILLGYSFGGPLVPAIVAGDHRFASAVMAYSGGGLYSLVYHNARRWAGALASEFVAVSGWWLLRPVEPLRYAGAISPTPLLMINGEEDEQIPRSNTEMLFNAAHQPKKILWIESRHVHPENVDLTKRIIGKMLNELIGQGILTEQNREEVE
jgi:dienelactone hydrolase